MTSGSRSAVTRRLYAPDPLLHRRAVSRALRRWYRNDGRNFTFRHNMSPYRVLVAEFLLRKTRAADADTVFKIVIARHSSPTSLASADEGMLRELIAPIGLPGRAVTLIAAARAIVERHGGIVPSRPEDLRALPGIGRYAAGAVRTLGFNRRSPMIDGPIGRLLTRISGLRPSKRSFYYDERLWRLIDVLAPRRNPRNFHLGLVDVADLFCKPVTPRCVGCPLRPFCAFAPAHLQTRNRLA